ncbi:hypothetical protein BJ508DRAFT_419566 [Ascobolus immersus RN42]|uniref:Uncharacterized protein n=1 Tax=Ascobolus immersus RN42 TaxID=1160509 RepID=A0A3N4HJ86_ASCIM|nr:hypothetical protein BJ508DRAFT_419566 [Ascobolus immersus RN42]
MSIVSSVDLEISSRKKPRSNFWVFTSTSPMLHACASSLAWPWSSSHLPTRRHQPQK